ncbi:MAG: hypothetical protein K2I23_04180, partial [Clostridia bacterium]|nr:hypothetical protein [Clostridia bacterium]
MNNENKNEQFKSLKEIDSFLRDVSKPFLAQIAGSKSKIKELEEKINSLKQERLAALYEQQQAEEAKTQSQAVENTQSESEENITAQEGVQTTQEETPSSQEATAQVAPQKEAQKTQTTYINPDMVRRG